jgi:thymidylate synthase (FAD)
MNPDVYTVLDKGFVQIIERMGDDLRAVEAARVSFQKGTSHISRDRALIDYLMEHGHESPFEHIIFTLKVKAPLFVARQWFRHRIGSFNEISARYSELKEEFYIPEKSRRTDPSNRQGSLFSEGEENDRKVKELIADSSAHSYETYQELLKSGVARELARIVLPLNLYTQWFWTVNARSMMNFLMLRADQHAQWEIQQYARAVGTILQEHCPWTYESFLKHRYKGHLLGRSERECDRNEAH